MNTENTKQRGRKAGSFTLANISLADIMAKFPNGTQFPVSYKWAMENGFNVKGQMAASLFTKPKKVKMPKVETPTETVDETAVIGQVVDLND